MVIVALIKFIGSFHPLLVHLPLGVLLLGCLMQWLSNNDKYAGLKPALPVIFFTGAITAILSCVSGYILSQDGEYESDLVNKHQWLGIITAVVSAIQYQIYKRNQAGERTLNIVAGLVIILITITGHLGGSLTHGSDYLTKSFESGEQKETVRKPIADINEAFLYSDVVQPLLQSKCYGCHGPSKQKGRLRLDQEEFILKGGEDGLAVAGGKPDESMMIERIMLPKSNEDHMPPKEKPQLSADEIALLHWWISTGAKFDAKVKDLQITEKISPVLKAYETGSNSKAGTTDIPDSTVAAPDKKTIDLLTGLGVIVLPVKQNSNYLMVNFITAEANADSLLKLMLPLKKQVIWLKLDNARLIDSSMKVLAEFTALTRLQLSNNPVTDTGIIHINKLNNLLYLNLTGTKVSMAGLTELKSISALKQLYVYQSNVKPADWSSLKQIFPHVNVDTGNYKLQFLASDTMIVEPPKKKKKKA